MALSIDAKKILVVAMANAVKAAEISTAIDANTAAGALSTTHNASNGTDHANVVLNDTHRASTGVNHANVVLNDAARNTNWKMAGMMIAVTGDATTDAATLGVQVGDFVVEVSVAGAAVTASGVVTVVDTFVGIATVGSVLIHFKPIV